MWRRLPANSRNRARGRKAPNPALPILLALLIGTGTGASAENTDEPAIVAALNASADAWSAGDLTGFMALYEPSPDTSYIGHTGLVRGTSAIQAHYAPAFAHGKPAKLGLSVMDFRPLGRDYALITGRFTLAPVPPATKGATGIFTLVFHKSAAGWRIISDHTS
jgi:uncharacterized protein (TIGR02246 family)